MRRITTAVDVEIVEQAMVFVEFTVVSVGKHYVMLKFADGEQFAVQVGDTVKLSKPIS